MQACLEATSSTQAVQQLMASWLSLTAQLFLQVYQTSLDDKLVAKSVANRCFGSPGTAIMSRWQCGTVPF